jgi:ribonuclease HI
MNELLLFIDGSVNTRTKVGFGAFLLVNDPELELDSLKSCIKTKYFENTSSTKLEIQTLLWALEDIQIKDQKVLVYTDSQNILGLPGRRERLEKNNYYTGKNKRINNFELYQQFYIITDQMNCELVKVQGHKKTQNKDIIDELFTLVDRTARKTQRNNNKESKNE